MPKNFMFIRHGESETNKSEIFQAGDQFEIDPINTKGQQQAEKLAGRFTDVPLDVILSTSYLRGMQTAQAVQRVTHAPICVPIIEDGTIRDLPADDPGLRDHVSLLRELDLPSELAGLTFKDEVAAKIKGDITRHLYDRNWRYSDEENLYDVWDRAGKILEYLEDRPEDTIAVVAHGGILKACIARIMQKRLSGYTERQQLEIYESFSAATWWDNTGVLSLRYDADGGWQWLMADNKHIGTEYFAFMPRPKTERTDTAPGDIYEK